MPNAVLAIEDSLNDRHHCFMLAWRLRSGCGFVVRGGNIRKQIAALLLVDDIGRSRRADGPRWLIAVMRG